MSRASGGQIIILRRVEDAETAIVDELVTACLDLTLHVRQMGGIEDAKLDRAIAAIQACGSAWRDRDCIPRRAVNVLVDLRPALWACEDLYEGTARQRVVDTVVRLGDLIVRAVG